MAKCKYRTLSMFRPEYVSAAVDRMLSKCVRKDGHLLFEGAGDGNGYGKLAFFGSTIKTHVLMYLHKSGDIPEGMCVCHTCNVKNCIEPSHLYLGSSSDNNSQAWKDGLQPNAVISDSLAKEIFVEGQNHRITHAELGKKYGVTRSIARKIRMGLAFKWIHG